MYNNCVNLALGPPQQTPTFQTGNSSVTQPNSNPYDDWSMNRDKGMDDFLSEEEIRIRSHEMLENEDMQQLLRLFSMGGNASANMPEDGFDSPNLPSPSPEFGFSEERARSGKAVVGWLKIKAAMPMGYLYQEESSRKCIVKKVQIVELDDDEE